MRLLLALLVFALCGAAPPPTIAVETWSLGNGLTVLMSRDARLPVVAVEVRYLVGSSHEVKGRSGFAHLFEHLMFQGSKNFDKEYFAPFEPIGGGVNGTTNVDRTNYYERVPENYLELALWMESDRMESLLPALTQAKLDNQRDVVKNERRQRYENTPYGMVWKYFHNHLFPVGHPYQHTTIGSHEDLSAASLEDVKGFFRQYYTPTNAVLTIVGDFDRDEAMLLVERYFGHLPKGERAPRPEAAMPTLAEDEHLTATDNVPLPRIHLAWHTPGLYADGDASMDVFASVLTDGKTSRLYKPLVYDQKVAKDVSAYQVSMAMSGFFVVSATAAPGKTVADLEAALKAALAAARKTPPTDDEMARVINGWRKSFFGRAESVISRASTLSNYYHLTGSADFLAGDLARYTELTARKVHDDATKWLSRSHLRVDIVPGAKSEEAK